MRRFIFLFTIVLTWVLIIGCDSKQVRQAEPDKDTMAVEIPDTAIYGVVGEGTTMHVLELLTEDGKTMSFAVSQDSLSDVQGGVFSGDKVTLTTRKGYDNGLEVVKLVNLTSLLGKWTSLDRNFEIQEDGVVTSALKAETHPYTHWSMANGNLILNADTFSILLLGPDSMEIEGKDGIYVYKRRK